MARSKAKDAESRSAQSAAASRFDQSGPQSTSKDNGFDSGTKRFDDNFGSDTNRFTDAAKPKAAKTDSFHDEWLDDSGRRDEMHDLGGSAALADDIRNAATSAARAVKEQAAAVASEVGHELEKTADEQIGRGADAIRGFAGAIEAAGAELEKVSPQLARLVNDSASKIRNVSDGLGKRQVNDMVNAATDFARQQPVLFLGAAIAAGFALARFLKSSAKPVQPDTMMAYDVERRRYGMSTGAYDNDLSQTASGSGGMFDDAADTRRYGRDPYTSPRT